MHAWRATQAKAQFSALLDKTETDGPQLVAATAKVHGLSLATLNRKRFEGFCLELVQF